MTGTLRWGAVGFVGLGLAWAGCSSPRDVAEGAGGSSSGTSGSSNAGAHGGEAGNAQGGSRVGGGAGEPGNDSGGDAGSLPSAAGGGVDSVGGRAGDAGSDGAGRAGNAGSGGTGRAGNSGAAGACAGVQVTFSSSPPTVFVLVDRSSSMFLCLSGANEPGNPNCSNANDTAWATLKQSLLEVVQELQGSVRFAFGSFTGELGKACPSFSSVGPALGNYDAIHSAYDALPAPLFKAETPTAQALDLVQTLLAADNSAGPKSVLLVTDGEPDFCDDGPPSCPVDATVSKLQTMYTAGYGALVLGLNSPLTSISGASLQAFANAGAGRPVVDPSALGTNIYDYCSGIAAWNTLFAATGKASPAAIATYGSAAIDAPVYRPDASNGPALKQALTGAVASGKNCTFDLSAGLAIDLTALSGASVTIQGQAVAQSASSGWSMVNSKRLQLSGSACSLWRSPASQKISFEFPCGSVLVE